MPETAASHLKIEEDLCGIINNLFSTSRKNCGWDERAAERRDAAPGGPRNGPAWFVALFAVQ